MPTSKYKYLEIGGENMKHFLSIVIEDSRVLETVNPLSEICAALEYLKSEVLEAKSFTEG